jgi:hypothetical protein
LQEGVFDDAVSEIDAFGDDEMTNNLQQLRQNQNASNAND